MSVSGMVAALEQELKWYREEVTEQRAIIKQLHRGYALPGEVTYIHPADLAELVDQVSAGEFITVDKQPSDTSLVQIKGQRFKMSPSMPQITNKYR